MRGREEEVFILDPRAGSPRLIFFFRKYTFTPTVVNLPHSFSNYSFYCKYTMTSSIDTQELTHGRSVGVNTLRYIFWPLVFNIPGVPCKQHIVDLVAVP